MARRLAHVMVNLVHHYSCFYVMYIPQKIMYLTPLIKPCCPTLETMTTTVYICSIFLSFRLQHKLHCLLDHQCLLTDTSRTCIVIPMNNTIMFVAQIMHLFAQCWQIFIYRYIKLLTPQAPHHQNVHNYLLSL